MQVPKRIRRDAKRLFRICCADGRLDEARARRVAESVSRSDHRKKQALLKQFLRLVRMENDRRTATVESVSPLSAELEAEVRSGLGRLHGPGLNVAFSQNPDLLGGLRIRVGYDVFDGTVKARLAALAEKLGSADIIYQS
jgi:F-type H+-transporting ATPase subunit delta